MRTVFKYPLNGFTMKLNTQDIEVTVPREAKFIAAMSLGELVVYALVDQDETRTEKRTIRVLGTGGDAKDDSDTRLIYIGTCMISWYVAHVFEAV